MSFYKEELVADSINFISMRAKQKGTTKLQELYNLVDEACAAHQRILTALSSHEETLRAYQSFASGSVAFYFLLENRYHLSEVSVRS
jgi:hypothetical protein